MNVFDAVRARRSVKSFTDRPLPEGAVESLLELVVLAPNHRMTEPWRFIVLGPEARRTYGGLKGESRARRVDDPEAAQAVLRKTVEKMSALPSMVAFVQVLDDDPEIREEDFATIYMGMQNFLLGAVAMGLGTHVKTGAILDEPATREALEVEEGERILALVQLGEPAEVPNEKPRTTATERTRKLL